MPEIKAIETRYAGCRFRSRLEARWARFFDAMGIDWEYEKEGYDLGEFGYYLPDFWLPQVELWAEVKPTKFTPNELAKIISLNRGTGFEVLMLDGMPENKPYYAIDYLGDIGDNDIGVWHDCVGYKEYCLTNYHDYPKNEHRFFGSPGSIEDGQHEDTADAVIKARSARFEHGESG